jgi:dihydroorotase
MPNTEPPLMDLLGGHDRAKLIAGQSLVDFRFHAGVDEHNADALTHPLAHHATSVKVFMTGHHTAHNVVRDRNVLEHIFELAARAGVRVVLHAEDDTVFALLERGRRTVGAQVRYDELRPRSGAIVAVAHVINLVRRHGTAAHVLHVASADEVDMLAAAAADGLSVTFEITPHHLTFDAADVERVGPRLWLSPAIRSGEDRDRLWRAVLAREVATIGSDHAPHTRGEKSRRGHKAPPGLPGVQEMLAAVHTGLARRLSNPDDRMALIASLMASNPSDLFGLTGRKGRLDVGQDGDLVIFDPNTEWTVEEAEVQSRCGWSAYVGQRMTGRPLVTIRRGEVIWDAATGRFGTPGGIFLDVASAQVEAPSRAARAANTTFASGTSLAPGSLSSAGPEACEALEGMRR